MALKDVIKDARLKRNLKQEEAAKMAGVTVQTYSKWENGKTEPKASQVAIISKVLGVSTEAICNGEESKKLNMMEFMKVASNLAYNLSPFDQQMAIWESIDDDYRYLKILTRYNKAIDETPINIRYEELKSEASSREYEMSDKLEELKQKSFMEQCK